MQTKTFHVKNKILSDKTENTNFNQKNKKRNKNIYCICQEPNLKQTRQKIFYEI